MSIHHKPIFSQRTSSLPTRFNPHVTKIEQQNLPRMTLAPDWNWSKHSKRLARTRWCEPLQPHRATPGQTQGVFDENNQFDPCAEVITTLAADRDTWITGNDPAIWVDWMKKAQ